MKKSLKTCHHCGAPIRVDRSIPAHDVVCGRCSTDARANDVDVDGAGVEPSAVDAAAPTDERSMTGYGLMLSSVGFLLVTVGGLILTFSNDHVEQIAAGEFIRFLGATSSFLGLMALSVGSFLCMFVLKESRTTVPLLWSIAALCVLCSLRLLEMADFVARNPTMLRQVFAVLIAIWLMIWTVYVGRTAKAAGRGDLSNHARAVLPVVAVCFSIVIYLKCAGAKSTDIEVQSMRLIACCLGLWITAVVFCLSRHLLDDESGRPSRRVKIQDLTNRDQAGHDRPKDNLPNPDTSFRSS